MRSKPFKQSVAACMLLVGNAWAGDAPVKNRPITIIAGTETLKVGLRCQVELNAEPLGRDEMVVQYNGKIVKATTEGVGLKATEERRTVVKKTVLSRAPFFDRLFRNVGIGYPEPGKEREVWVPSEKIHSVTLLESSADIPSDPRVKAPDFPPVE